MKGRSKNNYLSSHGGGNYATSGTKNTTQKPSTVKSYYATNSSSLNNSISRKKSVTAVTRQQTNTNAINKENGLIPSSHHQAGSS